MSFLVSKPERIRVSVSILLALLFSLSEKQYVWADIVGGFLCDARNHTGVRDVGGKAGVAASTPEKKSLQVEAQSTPSCLSDREETRRLIL